MLFGVVEKGTQAEINADKFSSALASHKGVTRGKSRTIHPNPSVAFGYTPTFSSRNYQDLAPVCSESGEVAVVFSGQIYNRKELSALVKPVNGSRKNDASLILELYLASGQDFIKKLNGKFAFAIHDAKNNSTLLVRDRFGIEPLYYFEDNNRLVFSTSMGPLRRYLDGSDQICFPSLGKFLLFGYNPSLDTLFTGIRKLRPGYMLLARGDEPGKATRYWAIDFTSPLQETEAAVAEELADQLTRAVERRVSENEDGGVFVSGGMDSSTVLGLSAKGRDARPYTFSYRCRGESYDESPYARHMAKSVNSIHHEVEYSPDDVLSMTDAIRFMEEPFCDVGINIATYLLGKAAGETVSYVMTGDGGDELFAGHPVYEADKIARFVDVIPGFIKKPALSLAGLLPDSDQKKNLTVKLKRFSESLGYPADLLSHRWRIQFRPDELTTLLDESLVEAMLGETDLYSDIRAVNRESEGLDYVSRSLYSDYNTVMDFYLRRNDINTGAGIETRYPMLDHELVEYCARIPVDMKIKGWFDNKYIFRKSMESILPDKIVHREDKLGHSIPFKNWLRDEGHVREFVLDHVSSDTIRKRGWFSPDYIKGLVNDHMNKRRNNSHRIWELAVLEMWMREHVDHSAS